MYLKLAELLFIKGGTTVVSQAVAAEGYNLAQVDFTLIVGSLDSVTIQGGNDITNWGDPATAGGPSSSTSVMAAASPVAAPHYELTNTATITTAQIRVAWTATAGNDTILAAGISLTNQ